MNALTEALALMREEDLNVRQVADDDARTDYRWRAYGSHVFDEPLKLQGDDFAIGWFESNIDARTAARLMNSMPALIELLSSMHTFIELGVIPPDNPMAVAAEAVAQRFLEDIK